MRHEKRRITAPLSVLWRLEGDWQPVGCTLHSCNARFVLQIETGLEQEPLWTFTAATAQDALEASQTVRRRLEHAGWKLDHTRGEDLLAIAVVDAAPAPSGQTTKSGGVS